MRKIFLTMMSFLTIMILAACGSSSMDEATVVKHVDHAEEVIILINQGNFNEVHVKFNEDMKEELPVSELEAITPIIDQSGNYEGIERSAIEERDDHYMVFIEASYTEENRTFSVTFNEQDEIAGLYVQ